MIRVKIDRNRQGEPIFKMSYKDLEKTEETFLRRALIDSKEITGMFKYEVPLRYFVPIFNNINKDRIIIDRHSKLSYLEFSDKFDEKYCYSFQVTPKYMKKWREEDCPNIFKIEINAETKELSKEIIFKKISRI